MSKKPAGKVQITADALIHLRAESPLARRLGIDCPYDHLFQTEAGAALVGTALSMDPVYEQFNLVRYAWFSRRMSELAAGHAQMVILGAGYDTRSLTLPAFQGGCCRVFEVDLPDVLSVKQSVLAGHGIVVPESVRYVPCDLNAGDLRQRLAAAGFDAAVPAAVVMEGVFFFLQGEQAAALLDPASIGLARGSAWTFDAWTVRRAQTLNGKLMKAIGRALFGDPPLGDSADEAGSLLRRRGYVDVAVTPLDALARQYGADAVKDPMPNSWLVIDARLA
jgi:methyltransferase (TIGR00027 family)